MKNQNDGFISLKEAAKISGYSSDYVGQLIRSGKIEGKQVFSNVAWVTTEDAVQAYLNKRDKPNQERTLLERVYDRYATPETLVLVYACLVWFVTAVVAVFVLFLGYVFSVSIDREIEARHLQSTYAN